MVRLAAHWARIGLESIVALTVLTVLIADTRPFPWAAGWGAAALPVTVLALAVFPRVRRRIPSPVVAALPFVYARAPFWLLDPASDVLAAPLSLLPLTWPGIVTVVAAYALAWRGETLAEDETTASSLLMTFQLGCLAMLVALAFGSGNPALSTFQGALLAIAYLLVGVVGLGTARWAAPADAPDSGFGWVGMLLVVGTGLTVVALLAAVVVSPGILSAAVTAVGWLLQPLGALIVAMLQTILEGIGQIRAQVERLQQVGVIPIFDFELPQWLLDVLGVLGVVLVVAGWIAAVIGLFRRLRRRFAVEDDAAGEAEEIERVEGGLRRDWQRFWAWLLGLFRRRKPQPTAGTTATTWSELEPEVLTGVRMVYRAFLAWAADRGITRYPSETPDELLRRIADRFPAVWSEAHVLTDHYVHARYARVPLAPTVLDEVRTALERIRTIDEASQQEAGS